MFRCSSSSLLEGKNVTFTLQYNSAPGEVLYVIGNQPQLGQWDVSQAQRMTWNCGNMWDVDVGFPENLHLQYKYFVMRDDTREIRWETIKNRDLWIKSEETICNDKWDYLPPKDETSSPSSP
eukprot:TRINITY_DN3443_c0_g1_i1.p1 TRINITY_DN3443_c0_g1~~TRINITY_DN3443_c0_g1_i1.p1  ORF type:complete len:122 (-),score=29.91 TRINITY_DN3443_c0_g1_i1:56-421(-)